MKDQDEGCRKGEEGIKRGHSKKKKKRRGVICGRGCAGLGYGLAMGTAYSLDEVIESESFLVDEREAVELLVFVVDLTDEISSGVTVLHDHEAHNVTVNCIVRLQI